VIFIGIDPGSSGAIAVIDGKRIEFYDTPTLAIKVGKTIKNKQDAAQCALMLRQITAVHQGDVKVTIERVAPMPSFKGPDGEDKPQAMGVTSAFTFGEGFGIWQGVCAGLLLPYQFVHPATWKKAMMPGMTKDKDSSRARVMQLYPQCTPDIARKKDHARADALLIAVWAQREYDFGEPPIPKKQETVIHGLFED
jgi:hypothetical protein